MENSDGDYDQTEVERFETKVGENGYVRGTAMKGQPL